jgi:hypothetical protein
VDAMIKIPLLVSLVLALLLSLAIVVPADTQIAEPTEVPTPIQPTSTSTPKLAATPTEIILPTATSAPTLTPTPTMAPVVEVTTNYKLNAVVPWGVVVEMLNETDQSTALILSIMAAESGGDPDVVSYAGACGLMQVIWKPWFDVSKSGLCSSNWTNIKKGIRILDGAVKIAQDKELDLRYGLAYYNCSVESVHSDGCGSQGGLHYADSVLGFWVPRVEERIAECAQKYGEDFWLNSNNLDRLGCNW